MSEIVRGRLVDPEHVLAYVVTREAFYGEQQYGLAPALSVSASPVDGSSGVLWEFVVTEHELGAGRKSIRVEVFDSAFVAFRAIPEFFAALDAMPAMSIADVVTILRRLDAVDRTPREAPSDLARWKQRPSRAVTG